jgi:hypothetical protein
MMRILALILATPLLTACGSAMTTPSGQTEGEAEAGSLFVGIQCDPAVASPAATWLDSPDALATAWRRARSSTFGATDAPPEVDFERFGVLLVEMGRRPTAGYAVSLADPEVELADGTAGVTVAWNEPAADAVTAQVVTSPCTFIRLPRGDYDTVTVTAEGEASPRLRIKR